MDQVQAPRNGLAALLDELPAPGATDHIIHVPPDWIEPNPQQPRQEMEGELLDELAASITSHGVIHPLLVRRSKETDRFELVCGERRLRAAQRAGLATVPCKVAEIPDERLLEFALAENLQRQDLNPIELAMAYKALMDQCGYTQGQLASRLGIERSGIGHVLSLLNLPEEVRSFVTRGTIAAGHGRALAGLPTSEAQVTLAERVMKEGLSVRQTESEVKKLKRLKLRPKHQPRPEFYDQVEDSLRRHLGTKVLIQQTEPGRGRIVIHFHGEQHLERLIEILSRT